MNELQKKELSLLESFIEVCNTLGLRYYLVCGSALGAVKYGGFIPWDDDMDVALPRPDYEVFLQQAQALLPDHVFLQNYRTDPACPYIFSKLRDSKTTYIEKSVAKLQIHHGIYIDIFPLDGYPTEKISQKLLELRKRMYQHQLNTAVEIPRSWKSMLHYMVYRFMGCHKRTASIVKRYEEMISSYPVDNSEYWCNHGNWQGMQEYAHISQYGQGRRMVFEGQEVTVPEHYDEYLRQKYGDYTQDPPHEEQVGHHYYKVCDTDKPYTSYLNKEV